MTIQVRNVGTDYYRTSSGNQLTANALDATINGIAATMPAIIPNHTELSYAKASGIGNFGIPLFEYVKLIPMYVDFRNPVEKNAITQKFRGLLLANPNSIGNLFLQYPKEYKLLPGHRTAFHDIQINAGSTFLSDIEVDIEQSTDAFIRQSLELRKKYPGYIVRPTLDIRMRTTGLFREKVGMLLQYKFSSFNVRFRSIRRNFKNWIALSDMILGKNIWCNVVGVRERWYGPEKISQISMLFNLGVHSASLGLYNWVGPFTMEIYSLDNKTMCYVKAQKGITYEQSRAEAVITHDIELANARRHIINGKYFSYYARSKPGLLKGLQLLS